LDKQSGPNHDRGLLTKHVDLIVRSHDRAWIGRTRAEAATSSRAVFIVGMLRSGTTLVEQMLASHPAAFGAGELNFWGAAFGSAIARAVAAEARKIETDDAALERLRAAYLALLADHCANARRVIDKQPTNFLFLGPIMTALPDARIIHLRRNPLDTCLSIYFQHFEAANAYANDLDNLAHYCLEYRRLMRHWQAVLPPGAMLEVSYEALIENPEYGCRQMLDFIGLPWDPRCLDFHRTERAVVTASRWQVRQRIHSRSVGRRRHYQKFLGSLRPLLDAD
jgi:hypothetical protein